MSSSIQPVRTRFAPSPTGFIHLGNIRSALYPWAFAKSQGGTFILRIEDTDLERSNQASVDVILEGMAWLGMNPDEGPFYQMQRMDRYKSVLADLIAAGHVYPCYMSMAELDALRERQMANKEKPRYDGTWRPAEGKTLPAVPESVKPLIAGVDVVVSTWFCSIEDPFNVAQRKAGQRWIKITYFRDLDLLHTPHAAFPVDLVGEIIRAVRILATIWLSGMS